MKPPSRIEIRLAVQAGLIGQVPTSLRAVCVTLEEETIYWKCIYERNPTDDDIELLSQASTELMASMPDGIKLEEEYVYIPQNESLRGLKDLVFLRYEGEDIL